MSQYSKLIKNYKVPTKLFSNLISIRIIVGCALSSILLLNTFYRLYTGDIKKKLKSKKTLMIVSHSLAVISKIFKLARNIANITLDKSHYWFILF